MLPFKLSYTIQILTEIHFWFSVCPQKNSPINQVTKIGNCPHPQPRMSIKFILIQQWLTLKHMNIETILRLGILLSLEPCPKGKSMQYTCTSFYFQKIDLIIGILNHHTSTWCPMSFCGGEVQFYILCLITKLVRSLWDFAKGSMISFLSLNILLWSLFCIKVMGTFLTLWHPRFSFWGVISKFRKKIPNF
jgi:hypothetical protein